MVHLGKCALPKYPDLDSVKSTRKKKNYGKPIENINFFVGPKGGPFSFSFSLFCSCAKDNCFGFLKMKGILLVALFACVAWGKFTYNETTATTMMDYCGSAYCCGNLGHGVEDWSCHACALNPGTQNITVISDLITQANGYVAYNVPQNRVIIAFSGTDPLNIGNWVDDIDVLKEKYPYCSKCKVHKGFYDAWKSVEDKVYAAVTTLRKAYPTATVAVTGHSLGAAISVHATLGLIQNYKLTPGTSLEPSYNFGDPRVGNKHFADYADKTMPDYFRVTHGRDPVPHLPSEWDHYHHIATEVYYNEKQTSYKICNGSGEDKGCADKHLVSLELEDHLDYLHFSITDNYLTCKL